MARSQLKKALVACAVSLLAPWAAAQSQDDLAAMSLESLMSAQVTSVSRREEMLQRTAAAVYVITREDIRRSGATDVADLLRAVPGVQVAQINGSVWAISARGFASQYATKMLVLVDGRSVYDPTFSGVYWHLQNLTLSDIERIEVIRGPGATMWGSNAVNGVVSISTRSSADTKYGLLTFDAGTARPGEGTVRYGAALGESASFRVFGRRTTRSSLASELGNDAGDEWRLTTGGFRFDWRPSSEDALTVDGDAYSGYQTSQQLYLSSLTPLQTSTAGRMGNDGGHVRARYSRTVGSDSAFAVQAYHDRRRHGGFGAKELRVSDLEAQYDFQLGRRDHLTVGGGYREIHDAFENSLSFGFTEEHMDSHLASLFVQDEIELVEDELDLTLGSKFETSSFTGFNAQPTVRLSWRPAFRHALWSSVSRAVRTANRVERGMYVNVGTFEAGPLPGLIAVLGDEGTRSEELLAYEAGYRYQSNRRLWLDVVGFFNDYDHLSTVEAGPSYFDAEPAPHLVAPLYFGNEMKGSTSGAEAALSYVANDALSFRGSYSFLRMQLESYDGSDSLSSALLDEGKSPRHQAYLGSAWKLSRALELAGNAYFVGRLPAVEVPAYARIDVSVTWTPIDKLELGLVGQNLLGAHVEFDDYEGTPRSLIERRIFGRIAWTF